VSKLEIGTDIIEISRIDYLRGKYPKFCSRIFTSREIAYCEQKKYPSQHYAARFAAKESILKALGKEDIGSIPFKDLEIINGPSGKPEVYFYGKARALIQKKGIKEIKVSLSHSKNYAIAIAQIW
jgi:holo-[acyl-carrier protein] synthase